MNTSFVGSNDIRLKFNRTSRLRYSSNLRMLKSSLSLTLELATFI